MVGPTTTENTLHPGRFLKLPLQRVKRSEQYISFGKIWDIHICLQNLQTEHPPPPPPPDCNTGASPFTHQRKSDCSPAATSERAPLDAREICTLAPIVDCARATFCVHNVTCRRKKCKKRISDSELYSVLCAGILSAARGMLLPLRQKQEHLGFFKTCNPPFLALDESAVT